MAKTPEVPISVWKELYAAAGKFYALKPWEYFDDSTLIGVRNPATGETGYGCILGALGEVLAFCFYRGAEGLDFHLKAQAGKIDVESKDFVLVQNCLMTEFTYKEELEIEDLNVIKKNRVQISGTRLAGFPQLSAGIRALADKRGRGPLSYPGA